MAKRWGTDGEKMAKRWGTDGEKMAKRWGKEWEHMAKDMIDPTNLSQNDVR